MAKPANLDCPYHAGCPTRRVKKCRLNPISCSTAQFLFERDMDKYREIEYFAAQAKIAQVQKHAKGVSPVV